MINDDIILKELKNTERINAVEKYKTAFKKVQFIKEIKNGLGEEIKENPNAIKIVKTPLIIRLKNFLKKIFTKF
jgi:hypothetical protein